MGQKVSPIGLRIGVNKGWESTWYADKKNFAKYLNNDAKIRRYLSKKLNDASVASILIERTAKKTDVIINTAKPGVVIGHGGEEIEKIRKELSKLVGEEIQISIICSLCCIWVVIIKSIKWEIFTINKCEII